MEAIFIGVGIKMTLINNEGLQLTPDPQSASHPRRPSQYRDLLGQDSIFQPGMKRLVGENVHPPVHGVLQLVFEVGEIEEALSPLKLDQDVDVALLVYLAADDGAEEGRSFDPVLSQDLDYCVTHGLHLIGHEILDVVDVFKCYQNYPSSSHL